MATLEQLRTLFGDGALIRRVEASIVITANSVLAEATPVTARREWAESAMSNTGNEALLMLKFLLAANSGLTVAQIQGASDSAINTAVSTAVAARFGAAA